MKSYLLWIIAFGFIFVKASVYAQTIEITSDEPSNTICRGNDIQVNVTVDPASDNYSYQWTVNGQWLKNAIGEEGTFHVFNEDDLLTENATIRVQVAGVTGATGNLDQSIDIVVDVPGNPGSNGDVLLCNQLGTIDLFNRLQGDTIETTGRWEPALANGYRGTFTVGVDAPGVYRYIVAGGGTCPESEASVTVRECINEDFDNDGVLNDQDLDDDNDGILDTEENSFCTPETLTESRPLVNVDFGRGGSTTDPNILGHTYTSIWPDDSFYNVATSLDMFNSVNWNPHFVATDSNPTPHVDGSGDVNGRYLAVNITSDFANQILYQITDIPIVAGVNYNFRIDLVGLCVGCGDSPMLDLELIDQNLPAGSAPIFIQTSEDLNVQNDDIWKTLLLNFTPTTTTFLTLNIRNRQTEGADGNDIGIDNIRFASLECDFDRDEVPNYLDLDSDNDGVSDLIEIGRGDLDTNNDGIVDGPVDPTTGIPTAAGSGLAIALDSDNNGFGNYLDIDSDGDGIPDNIEAQTTDNYLAPSGIDNNLNGLDDVYDRTAIIPIDTDDDGLADYMDLNSDNDCLSDTIEGFDLNQDGSPDIIPNGTDTDNDGLDDAFDLVALDLLTDITNPTNNSQTPNDFPDNHNPGNNRDFREEFTEVDEETTANSCSGSTSVINLYYSLIDTQIPGGTWSGPTPLSGGDLGTYDPQVNTAGDYVYTLPNLGSCPPRKGTVSVIIGNISNDGSICDCPDIEEPTSPTNEVVCFGNANPELSVSLLEGQTANWYTRDGELLASNTATFTPTETESGTYIYNVEALDIAQNCASDRIEVLFAIATPDDIELSLEGVICVDLNGDPILDNSYSLPVINSGLNRENFSFIWRFEGNQIQGTRTSPWISVSRPGQYELTHTNTISGCSYTSSIEVPTLTVPERLELSLLSESFDATNGIVATVIGNGTYEYSLDGNFPQESNIFDNVDLGLHTVTAIDTNGCGQLTEDIFVLGFPNYFTPNNDGTHDTWNVIADEDLPDMTIFIFDRYGKLLTVLDPLGAGWDGTFNKNPLPATDYWFLVQFDDGSEPYQSHFTLKR